MRVRLSSINGLWTASLIALIAVSWSSYMTPSGSWLSLALPAYVVALALMGIAYQGFHRRGRLWRGRPADRRLSRGLLIGVYVVAVMVSGVKVRNALPHYEDVVYSVLFWGASGAILLSVTAINGREVTRGCAALSRGLRLLWMVLLFFIGVASGPVIWGWGPGPTKNTAAGMMAAVIYVTPLILYAMQVFPFSPMGRHREVGRPGTVGGSGA